ncbi:Uncharacterised protein [Legionella waltersii]|nr:Uncharacterised protein [Legionella waltersii]
MAEQRKQFKFDHLGFVVVNLFEFWKKFEVETANAGKYYLIKCIL